jgi:hypothetical protein
VSTNYYVRPPQCDAPCRHCGQAQEIHLGLMSAGWRFLHRAYRDPTGIHDVGWPVVDRASWLRLLDLGDLYNEYGDRKNKEAFLEAIESKQAEKIHRYAYPQADAFEANGYEFIDGEFS